MTNHASAGKVGQAAKAGATLTLAPCGLDKLCRLFRINRQGAKVLEAAVAAPLFNRNVTIEADRAVGIGYANSAPHEGETGFDEVRGTLSPIYREGSQFRHGRSRVQTNSFADSAATAT